MSAFMDATCPKCKRRVGWTKKRPPCPHCGYVVPAKDQEADDKILQEFRDKLKGIRRAPQKDDTLVEPKGLSDEDWEMTQPYDRGTDPED